MRLVRVLRYLAAALVLSAGPAFISFAWLIGAEIRLTEHPLLLIVNLVLAAHCWAQSVRSATAARASA